MKSNRLKITTPAIKSRQAMEGLVREICTLKIEETTLKAEMDRRITSIKKAYETQLSDIVKSLGEKMTVAEAWAESNPEEFGDRKSIDMLSGIVGWRIGTPALKTLRGWTWDRVLEKIKTLSKMASVYVRTKEEVDKQQIISDRKKLTADELAAIGVRIKQDDEFFVDPKLTPVEKREVAA